MSSLARIFLAFTNICFSPVDRPFSWSRSERFRTTSASSRMSTVFIHEGAGGSQRPPAESGQYSEDRVKTPTFQAFLASKRESPWKIRGRTSDPEIPVDEVVLLKAAQALADLPGSNRADAVDSFQVPLRGAHDRVEPVHLGHDAPDHAVGEPWDVREHAVAARRHRVVERVHRRRVPDDREELELE